MEEERDDLSLHAWSPADACQLIQHHGQPYHPEWTTQHDDTDQQEPQQTQVVTRQDGGADSRSRATTGIRHVGRIIVHIPSAGKFTSDSAYSDCWGAPPAGQLLSPQAWSGMLGEMRRQWRIRADRLLVLWDESYPISVKGLLDALLLEDTQHYLKQLLMEQEGGRQHIRVKGVAIDLNILHEWSRIYLKQSVVSIGFKDLQLNDGQILNKPEKRRATWYVTGETRLSSILEDTYELAIHSMSPFDASQLIKQHGQPHHPEWTTQHDDADQQEPQQTQVVTRQEGGADSKRRAITGIRHVRSIDVHIPSAGEGTSYSDYSDCWGAPPAGQLLSPQAWSEMLGEMSRQWRIRANALWIKWDESCPISVKGLLDALLQEDTQPYLKQLLVEQEGGWRDVRVEDGNIDSSDLCEWTRCYTQHSVVRVQLLNLLCNISKDEGSSREDQEAAVRALEDTVHGGERLFETSYSGPRGMEAVSGLDSESGIVFD